MRNCPYRDCSTEYQCDECSETFTCSSAEEREARLLALLDERTALLRECATSRAVLIAYVIDITDGEVPEKTNDLSRRIAATLKETTCDS